MAKLRLSPAQLRALTHAAQHQDGRFLSSALQPTTIDKLFRAGLIEQDGYWRRGPLWRITAAGRAIVEAAK